MMNSYRELQVWQVAMELAKACYDATRSFPREEAFGLTSQIRRASVSVPANIAEGYGRDHRKEYVHHISMARGSLLELETHLILAQQVGLLGQEILDQLLCLSQRVGQMSLRLKKSLQVEE
jgi:four helix bundle protein